MSVTKRKCGVSALGVDTPEVQPKTAFPSDPISPLDDYNVSFWYGFLAVQLTGYMDSVEFVGFL